MGKSCISPAPREPFEHITNVYDKRAWQWRRRDPATNAILDLKPSYVVLQQHCENAVVAVLANAPARARSVICWRGILKDAQKPRWGWSEERVEVVFSETKRLCNGREHDVRYSLHLI